MSLLSILVFMLILNDHRFRMGCRSSVCVPSELQLTDFFTKTHAHGHHQFYLSKLNVVDPSYEFEGVLDMY
jgi:hypothetical protein